MITASRDGYPYARQRVAAPHATAFCTAFQGEISTEPAETVRRRSVSRAPSAESPGDPKKQKIQPGPMPAGLDRRLRRPTHRFLKALKSCFFRPAPQEMLVRGFLPPRSSPREVGRAAAGFRCRGHYGCDRYPSLPFREGFVRYSTHSVLQNSSAEGRASLNGTERSTTVSTSTIR